MLRNTDRKLDISLGALGTLQKRSSKGDKSKSGGGSPGKERKKIPMRKKIGQKGCRSNGGVQANQPGENLLGGGGRVKPVLERDGNTERQSKKGEPVWEWRAKMAAVWKWENTVGKSYEKKGKETVGRTNRPQRAQRKKITVKRVKGGGARYEIKTGLVARRGFKREERKDFPKSGGGI